MNSNKVVGIVIYGKMKEIDNIWAKWFVYARSISNEMKSELTHISISCVSLNSKLKVLKRNEKKILKIIENGEYIESISFYALKNGFTSVVDNELCLLLTQEYIYRNSI